MSPTVRDRVLAWYKAGLLAVEPEAVTADALRRFEFPDGRIIVLALGKAALPMAKAAQSVLGTRIDAGLLVTKRGQLPEAMEGFTNIESGHPIPDNHSLKAGELSLHLVNGLTGSDTVIALISGGGSALLEQPIDGVSLMDMQVTTELMMYAGAGITELNTVRKALSQIKGGGLRRAIGPATCITLMLSDVLGNVHTTIASGPTVPAPTNRHQAWRSIMTFGLEHQVPESVRLALTIERAPEPLTEIPRDHHEVIADNQTFVSAVASAAADGKSVAAWHEWDGSSRSLASDVVRQCLNAQSDTRLLFGGGEATSEVTGSGRGGRNTDTALRAAIEFKRQNVQGWTFASLASDGDDGNSGSAGAIVDANSVADLDQAEYALLASDSAGYLEQQNALVVTGQTATNVNDVYIAVRTSASSGDYL